MQRMKKVALSVALAGGVATSAGVYAADLNSIIKTGSAKVAANQQSQERVEAIADSTDERFDDYKQTNKRIENVRLYNAQLEKTIRMQEESMQQLDQSIKDVVVMQRQMPPLAERMITSLEQFVALDMPFRLDERNTRIEQLRANLVDPKFSVSERFRQVLEAYKIEDNYSRFIDTYTDTINVDGTDREVNILQVGRIALLAQTKDNEVSLVWSKADKAWTQITDSDYRSTIVKAVRIAKKQAVIEVLELPVAAPEAN